LSLFGISGGAFFRTCCASVTISTFEAVCGSSATFCSSVSSALSGGAGGAFLGTCFAANIF